MPANLPPQYIETEKKLKTARSNQEKLAILEELLSIVPKHKGTEKIQAMLKTKIAKLKSMSEKKGSASRRGPSYLVEKAGAGQLILIGPPNSGKSQLLKSLTNAHPDIGDYPFTTHTPAPGMMPYENIQIQLVDTPPISAEYFDTAHMELVKAAEGVLFILDLSQDDPYKDFEIILEKYREKYMEIVFDREDILSNRQIYFKNVIVAANKSDSEKAGNNFRILQEKIDSRLKLLLVSAKAGEGLEHLKEQIFKLLKILRVYSKIPGKDADLNDPYVFKIGSTVMDMAKTVHKDFSQKLKFARIWGKTKYQGQKVNRDYVLEDEDIIELHL